MTPQLTPGQLRTRQRIESLIRLAQPGLNLDYYPPRVTHEEPPEPGS